MLPVSEKIMSIFEAFNTDGWLPWNSFSSSTQQWARNLQDQVSEGLKELTENRFIRSDDSGLYLLELGRNHLYSAYTIEDTEKAILEIFREYNIGKGDSLTDNVLVGKVAHFKPPMQRTFEEAMNELIRKGILRKGNYGVILTDIGYGVIYS